MSRDHEDAAMRAQLAMLELDSGEVDELGQIKDKPAEVYRLRVGGVSFEQIAKRMGYQDARGAHQAYTIYLQQQRVRITAEKREELLDLQLSRIEALLKQNWSAAMLGDPVAASLVLRCITETAKLCGLYEPREEGHIRQYILINSDRGQYVDQLREIATKTESTDLETSERS